MLTINYPAFGPEVNVLTAFDNAMDVVNPSIKTVAGGVGWAHPPQGFKGTPANVFTALYYFLLK
jgi:hypothetical protein